MKKLGDTLSDKLGAVKKSAVATTKTPENKGYEKHMVASSPDEYYMKPTLYLDSKDFPGVRNLKGKSDVYLAIRCKVNSFNESETIDDKGKSTSESRVNLEIVELADLTELKGGK